MDEPNGVVLPRRATRYSDVSVCAKYLTSTHQTLTASCALRTPWVGHSTTTPAQVEVEVVVSSHTCGLTLCIQRASCRRHEG